MTFRNWLSAAAIATAMMSATPALADHAVIYAPRTDAFAASQAPQGPAIATSLSRYINGAQDPGSFKGNGGTISGGGSTGATWAASTQDGGFADLSFHNNAYAAADLAAGTLKASTVSTGQELFGEPAGYASARLDDTIFFTNNSGVTQMVTLRYAFDGTMTNPYAANGVNPGGSVSFNLSCTGWKCYNETGDRIAFAAEPTRAPENAWQYYWTTTSSCFGENIYCGQAGAPYFQWGLNQPNAGGVVDGWMSTSLLIPTGLSSIGLSGSLNLDCRGASSCDFGHTGKFGFAAMPDGVSFSSASGLFLTATGGAVPEPASWAMMILGFGLVGAALRRRAVMPVAA